MTEVIIGCQHYAIRLLYGQDSRGRKGIYIQILKDATKEKLESLDLHSSRHRKILDSLVLHTLPVSDENVKMMLDTLLHLKAERVKAKMECIIMSIEEHDRFVHPCGLTGKELDLHPGKCKNCDKEGACLQSHSVTGWDEGVEK